MRYRARYLASRLMVRLGLCGTGAAAPRHGALLRVCIPLSLVHCTTERAPPTLAERAPPILAGLAYHSPFLKRGEQKGTRAAGPCRCAKPQQQRSARRGSGNIDNRIVHRPQATGTVSPAASIPDLPPGRRRLDSRPHRKLASSGPSGGAWPWTRASRARLQPRTSSAMSSHTLIAHARSTTANR